MKYLASYCWQECSGMSLSLQQAVGRRHKLPILFACICAGEDSDRAGKALTDWFYEKGVRLGGKGDMETIERELKELVEMGKGSGASGWKGGYRAGAYKLETLLGIYCAGDVFLIFSKGRQRVYLFNTCFQHANSRRLTAETKDLCCLSGIMQPGIGILLAVEDFFTLFSEQELKDCLGIRHKRREPVAERLLGELSEEGIRRGGRNMSAVYLVTSK